MVGKYVFKANREMTGSHKKIMLRELCNTYNSTEVLNTKWYAECTSIIDGYRGNTLCA